MSELATITRADESVSTMAALQDGYGQERDLLNQLLGQAQLAGAFEDFSRTVRTSKLAYVKENKLYRSLAGTKNPHGAEKLTGTWEEFCKLLGRSVDQVDRDIVSLKTFGEEALESMSRMGIGYRELRQYRRLPEDQKSALIEAAKAGDKDSFLELAEDLIAKHAKEKEFITARAESAEQTSAAKDEVLSKKQSEITKLQTQVATKKYLPHVDWPEAMKGYIEQAQKAGNEVCNALDALKTIRENAMKVTPESADERACLGNAWMALAEEMSAILDKVSVKLESEKGSFENTLNAVAEEHREENQ